MRRGNSPYSAAITGGGFLFEEMDALLPLLKSPEREALVKDELVNNRILHINAEKSRSRNINEIKRRFDVMPPAFWEDYQAMIEDDRRIALLFVILKTYKILFDFQINVAIKKWNSVSRTIDLQDLAMEMNEIAAKDEFVDSWSESTKTKVASAYLSMLRKCGMMNREGNLVQLKPSNADFYIRIGEPWFLEACFLAPYQIDKVRQLAASQQTSNQDLGLRSTCSIGENIKKQMS